MENIDFLLASKSPRRIQLLTEAGYKFSQVDICVDESKIRDEAPLDYVARMAYLKSHEGFVKAGGRIPCLGADTVVVKDREIFGKPHDFDDCRRILRILSGKNHEVITAVCIVTAEDCIQEQVVSRVVFREITEGEIEEYWNTGEPRDKAGAYAIQGIGAKFVSSLEGSLTNVIGLPMEKVRDMLQSVSVSAGL